MVKPRLRAPADVHGAVDVGLGPLHDLAKLLPIVHLLKVQKLYGGTRDDHAVVFLVADVVKGLVEGEEMLLRRVLGLVGLSADEGQLDLQGGISQDSRDLRFGLDLFGHEIEKHDTQRTDVLGNGSRLGHHKDIFIGKGLHGRQIIGDFNGHFKSSPVFIRSPEPARYRRSGRRDPQVRGKRE